MLIDMEIKFNSYSYQEVVKGKTVNFTLLEGLTLPEKAKITSVACIPYIKSEDIVVTKLERGYDIPGGHVENSDNTLLDALKRELSEEVGLIIGDSVKIIGVISSDYYGSSKEDISYMVITTTQNIIKLEDDFEPQLESLGREVMSDKNFLAYYKAGDKTLMNILVMRARHILGKKQLNETREFFTTESEWDRSYANATWAFLNQNSDEYERLNNIVQYLENREIKEVLDIGCAYGNIASILSNSVNYLGIDIAPTIIQRNQKQSCFGESVKFHVSDFTKKGVIFDKKFDAIVASEILYYFNATKLNKFIENIKNNLAQDGILCVSMCRSDRSDIHPTDYYWKKIGEHFEKIEDIVFSGDTYTWDIAFYQKNNIWKKQIKISP